MLDKCGWNMFGGVLQHGDETARGIRASYYDIRQSITIEISRSNCARRTSCLVLCTFRKRSVTVVQQHGKLAGVCRIIHTGQDNISITITIEIRRCNRSRITIVVCCVSVSYFWGKRTIAIVHKY